MLTIEALVVPADGLISKQCNVQAFLGQQCCGTGTLFIMEDNIYWQKQESSDGFSLEYPLISMHGISKDVSSSFPHQCVLCLVDAVLPGSTMNQADNEVTEVRFVPEDLSLLEKIYSDIAECQKNHPDPDEEFDEDEEGELDYEMYGADSENIQLSEEGQAVLQRLAGTMEMPSQGEFEEMIQNGRISGDTKQVAGNGQFDDADDVIEEER